MQTNMLVIYRLILNMSGMPQTSTILNIDIYIGSNDLQSHR